MTVQSWQSLDERERQFRRLIDIGIAMAAERNRDRLLENILLEAKNLTRADGGTLYLRTDDDKLQFAIMRTTSLGIALGGTTGKPITFPPLPMMNPETGEPNLNNVATACAITGEIIEIEDAYVAEDYDFSGTKKFDEGTGYRSKSFLAVPLRNNQDVVIGVIQLLNAQDEDGAVTRFDAAMMPMVEALTSQAAVALDNMQLAQAQRDLLDAFIKVIAGAIDAKSPYTGGHCQRVPVLTKALVAAAHDEKDGPFSDFVLNDDQWYALHLAAWLHDCGKVTTPEYVVDKATKLETINNRIHEVRTRFEVLKRDAEIAYLKARLDGVRPEAELKAHYEAELAQLDDDFAFIAQCNEGAEFMDPADQERVKAIAQRTWTRTLDRSLGLSWEESQRLEKSGLPHGPAEEKLLDDSPVHMVSQYNHGEIYNLCVARGTLTGEERKVINDHIVVTIEMLEQLPFPKHLRHVPEYAGGHHEKMDGTGYPRGLKRDEMSIPARVMAIADIFEALTAADRPYKKPKKLSEAIRIMSFMKKDNHVDPELFDLFLRSGVYKDYAAQFLLPEQIDEVDITPYLSMAAE